MRLTDLTTIGPVPEGIEIGGITSDSREVRPGWLFAALKGVRHDGRNYISEAINNGAVAILTDAGTNDDGTPAEDGVKSYGENDVVLIRAQNPRHELSMIAARFYGLQPAHIAAVTGTNGKTSTVHFTRQLWEALGEKAASLGTLGVQIGGRLQAGSMTTPDPVKLHAGLADLAAAGITHLAMEASSHGLHQHRLDGVRVDLAGFTNFSHDHLDYHKTMDDYLQAKSRLFSTVLVDDGTAVVNADIPEVGSLLSVLDERDADVLTYGYNGDDIILRTVEATSAGQDIVFEVKGHEVAVTLPLVGAFQVMNILCAVGLVVAQTPEDKLKDVLSVLQEALPEIKGAPGRLEHAGNKGDAAIYVDYAHTPDALEHVLKALRPHAEKGRLVCLVGCGGDRDARKRPLMGQVAADYADYVIVTDDNPRSEDPAAIRAEILNGIANKKKVAEVCGRAKAIVTAIKDLKDGDLLLVAGKGHETGQIVGDQTLPFNDVEEVKKTLSA